MATEQDHSTNIKSSKEESIEVPVLENVHKK